MEGRGTKRQSDSFSGNKAGFVSLGRPPQKQRVTTGCQGWRVDETYLKLRGQWFNLYRAVDKQGKTVESYLSRTRDVTAAKAFFRKAFRRHGDPRVITLDGFEPTHAALRRMGMNNVMEQDHRYSPALLELTH